MWPFQGRERQRRVLARDKTQKEKIIRSTYQRSSASYVMSLVTMSPSVQTERRTRRGIRKQLRQRLMS